MSTSENKIIISPKTKVGELLDYFPGLESVLIGLSPSFEKLRNPILRKTVARVATLQQVAIVGGLNIDEMIRTLRKEAGQIEGEDITETSEYFLSVAPDWFDTDKIISCLNATPIINSGGSPLSDILKMTKLLNPGEIFELHTPFVPAPIIDMLKGQGFRVYCIQLESSVKSYLIK